jgi:hypothetical protein
MTTLLNSHAITTAQSLATVGSVLSVPADCTSLTIESSLTYGSGGTSAKAYVQTSLDGGSNFIDIMCFAFTTTGLRKVLNVTRSTAVTADVIPTVGSITDDTSISGIIGDIIRIQVVTTGTYGGSTTLDMFVQMGSS